MPSSASASSTTFSALITLIDVLAWPVVAVIALLYLGLPLRRLFAEASELSFGGAGFVATAKRRQIEAAAALGAARATAVNEAAGSNSAEVDASQIRDIANTVLELVTPRAARRLARAQVLWVDDRPANNTYERTALEALGIQVTTSTSTEDALDKVRHRHFDIVISDMGRGADGQAGYVLLEALQAQGVRVPFIVYSRDGGRAEHRTTARERGALDSTSSPQELLALVSAAAKKMVPERA